MRDILKVSVYDPDMYVHFRDVNTIQNEFTLYRNFYQTYKKQYLTRLLLIASGEGGKYLPKLLDGGNGKEGQKEKGLIQYFLQGMPNRSFATKMWKDVSNKKRVKRHVRTFDDFVDEYDSLICKLEDKLRTDYITIQNTFKVGHVDTEPVKPSEKQRRGEDRKKSSTNKFSRSRGRFAERVNNIDEEEPIEDEKEFHEDAVDESDSDVVPPLAKEVSKPVKSLDSDEEHEEEADAASEEECEWLQGVSMDPEQKRPPPCWKFAINGKCDFGSECIFSHHPDDAKAYLAAKKVGKTTFSAASKNFTTPYARPVSRPTGSFGSSPGIRPKVPSPITILKSSGNSGTRKV